MTAPLSQRLLGIASRRTREIATPEGVPLPVEIADLGERLVAFGIDSFLGSAVGIVLLLVVILAGASVGLGSVAVPVGLFAAFVGRNAYYLFFESKWHGSTPGKRALSLKVIDRRGIPLSLRAVVARNLMREIEIFFPLELISSHPAEQWTGSGWEALAIVLWLVLFVAFPLSNRDRMRAGDLVAGTIVVVLPRHMMLADLTRRARGFTFTDAQLAAYGVHELYLLEGLLRQPEGDQTLGLCKEVGLRICRKIDWPDPIPDDRMALFLADFYTAQRAHLEALQLVGRRRRNKYDTALAGD